METIKYTDFSKLDIRIGTVIGADVPEWSHWVMKLSVDFGEELGHRTIFAGIMKFYKPEDLIGKQFPFLVNIEPKKIGPAVGGVQNFSEGMMLAASVPHESADPEQEKPILLHPSEKVPEGSKIR